MKKPITIDFETQGIESRPTYPPKPVGVAVKYPGKKAEYFAWGHPTENNCTKEKARDVLTDVYRSGNPVLCHNAKFDLDVAETHFKLRLPSWSDFHDSLFLLFLDDPHAASLSLKPAAEKLLGMKQTEKDAVHEWLIENKIVPRKKKQWEEHIAKAPGKLVGTYAIGDVVRTEKLFSLLHKKIEASGMGIAYDRERRLLPILLRNEREGIQADVELLRRDIKAYENAQKVADEWLRKRLKTKDLNLDSDDEVAEALERSGVVTEFVKTPTGKNSVSKKNLSPHMFKDPKVASVLGYRSRIETCLSVFLRSWLSQAETTGGTIHTSWNSTRQTEKGGTRTGRFSSSPNFQNIPKDWYDKDDGYVHPKHLGVPELPIMRKYILPDKGQAIGHRDYNQQELRILAHFENDQLCAEYNRDPRLDVHTLTQKLIKDLAGLDLERRAVKVLNFGDIYGMGKAKLAAAIRNTVEMAGEIRAAKRKAMPGLASLERDIKQRAHSGQPIKTWGGRLYYCEPPKMVDGRMWDFAYKMLNYLIQGSAADCTKEAIIRYDAAKKDGRFLLTVHDENNISVPPKAMNSELKILKESMNSVEFDVPMLSDAKAGPNWGALKKVED